MIDAVVDAAKQFAGPASLTFFIALLAVGVALSFWRRTQRGARWYFTAVLVSYWVLASPACAERLLGGGGPAGLPPARAAPPPGPRGGGPLGRGHSAST